MKIYIILEEVDYSPSEIMKTFKNKEDAELWVKENEEPGHIWYYTIYESELE